MTVDGRKITYADLIGDMLGALYSPDGYIEIDENATLLWAASDPAAALADLMRLARARLTAFFGCRPSVQSGRRPPPSPTCSALAEPTLASRSRDREARARSPGTARFRVGSRLPPMGGADCRRSAGVAGASGGFTVGPRLFQAGGYDTRSSHRCPFGSRSTGG